MRIILNGSEAEVAATRLDAALAELGYTEGHYATAVNEAFVRREARAETTLSDGDRVEVVAPLQGG